MVSADIMEYYLRKPGETSASPTFIPRILGIARLHFVNKAAGLDVWETRSWIALLKDSAKPDWDAAQTAGELGDRLSSRAPEDGNYADAPAALLAPKNYASWRKDLASHIYRCATFTTLRCPQVGANAAPGGSEGDFRARLSLALREKRDSEIDKLRRKYAPRLTKLQDQIRRAEDRVERERGQLSQYKTQTAISIGTSILGALLGRKRISVANVGRVGSAARSAGRIGREGDDVGRAEENREALEQRLKDMQNELEQDIDRLAGEFDPANATIERFEVKPRKSDIEVLTMALLWVEE